MKHLSHPNSSAKLNVFRAFTPATRGATRRHLEQSWRTRSFRAVSLMLIILSLLLPLRVGAEHGSGLMLLKTAAGAEASVPSPVTTLPIAASSAGLLQFTAGEHVLGFAADAAWFAAGSHALRVGFEDVNAAAPRRETPAAAPGQTAPLERVTYANLWDGITLTYAAAEGTIAKSTYHLAPGADPAQIRLRYNVPVALQADGSLRLAFRRGWMSESAPVAWQETQGQRRPVDVTFEVRGQTVGFALGDYDPARPLTIDPAYAWHTFYGSSSEDRGHAIARDGEGDLYVAGYSMAAWNGPDDDAPLHAYSGSLDITVLSLTSAGVYRWHTFYGSSNASGDFGYGVASNGDDALYVIGYSAAAWNGDNDASPLHNYSGGLDITVLSLTNAGAYRWHTFYGSSISDCGSAIACDGDGALYVTGYGYAWNGDDDASPRHAHSGLWDISVLSLVPTYTVTPSADPDGSVSPNTPQTVNHGSTTNFTVTPETGYTAAVGGDCPEGGWNGSVYTTAAITANCAVNFSFTLQSYTVTPDAGTGGSVNPNTPQSVTHGNTTSFTVTANPGYAANSAIGGTCPAGGWNSSAYTTGAITANCTASFSFTTTGGNPSFLLWTK